MKITSLTPDQQQFLIKYYSTEGAKWCSEQLNLPPRHVQQKANKLGLRLSKDVRGRIVRENKTIKKNEEYSVNPEQFFDVKTPEVAYILGLLWADGYVLKRERPRECGMSYGHGIRLQVQEEDFNIFIKTLQKTGRWCVKYIKSTVRKTQGSASISNKPLVEYLIKHGYTSKSTSSACSILSTIPNHLKHYWFRGLFDGDGCIYHNPDGLHINTTICSSYDQDWTYMTKLFLDVLNETSFSIHKHKGKRGSYSKFGTVKRSAILKFLNYIYEGYETDGIGLPRKHEKYFKVVERERHCQNRLAEISSKKSSLTEEVFGDSTR